MKSNKVNTTMKRTIFKVKTKESTDYYNSAVVHPDGTLEAKGKVSNVEESMRTGFISGLERGKIKATEWTSVERIELSEYGGE